MKELADSGVKYNPDDVVMITKTPDGTLVWLEKGSSSTGLQHIIDRHAEHFVQRGIEQDKIPQLLEQLMKQIPDQITTTARGVNAIYILDGKKYLVAYGNNGYIVSFYPIS